MKFKINKIMMSKKEIVTLKNDLTQNFVIDSLMQKGNINRDALEPFNPNFDFIQLIQKMKEILGKKENKKKTSKVNQPQDSKKPVDWTMQLAVINYLRRLFKYEKDIFNQAFYGLKIFENIIEFLNSIRSILAQNALILINEVFSEYVPEVDDKNQKAPVIQLIKTIIPSLVLKATTSQSFIKNEAKTCLETMVENMKYSETLMTLLQLLNTKKIADFELIQVLSQKLIRNLGKEFFVKYNHFGGLMNALGSIYENNKSDLYKRKCKSILNTFVEIMTKEEFDKKLDKCSKKEKEHIKIIFEDKVPPNTKKEIHNLALKSKDEKKKIERPKSNCNTKQVLKKKIQVKLLETKETVKQNSENVCNNENIVKENPQVV